MEKIVTKETYPNEVRLVRDIVRGLRRGPGGISGLAATVPSEIATLQNSSIL